MPYPILTRFNDDNRAASRAIRTTDRHTVLRGAAAVRGSLTPRAFLEQYIAVIESRSGGRSARRTHRCTQAADESTARYGNAKPLRMTAYRSALKDLIETEDRHGSPIFR
jgi:hypothetical protein